MGLEGRLGVPAPLKAIQIYYKLEVELRRQLDDTRIKRASSASKKAAVDVDSHGVVDELRMIKEVEYLQAQFNLSGFCDLRIFVQTQIKIVNTRSMEEVSSSIPEHSAHLRGEVIGVEEVVALDRRAAVRLVIKARHPWVKGSHGTQDVRTVGAAEARVIPAGK